MQMVVKWTKESLDEVAQAFPKGEKLYMLNLLRFRKDAGDGRTGRDVFFGEYSPAFARVSESVGSQNMPFFIGAVAGSVVGPDGERWDAMGVIEYDSFDDFYRATTSDAYAEQAAPFREAALEDARLIACTRINMG